MKLVAKTPHSIVLRPWRPSAGVEAWYATILEKAAMAMVLSTAYWIKRAYGSRESKIALDEADGHPFRGNQYTGGESGEEKAKEHGKGGVKGECERLIKEGKLTYAEIAKVVATKLGGHTSKESVAWYASKLKQAGKKEAAPEKPMHDPHLHPEKDEHGKPVNIAHPTEETSEKTWTDKGKTATFVPGGSIPASLNGVAVSAWEDHPTTAKGWDKVEGQDHSITEPPLPKTGKAQAAGVIITEPDGRVWTIHPTNGFGGYDQTFPKGHQDEGVNLQATAIKEAFEETGLKVQITGFAADVERTTTQARYYTARRVGGDPTKAGWESQAVSLVPKEDLKASLTAKADQKLVAVAAPSKAKAEGITDVSSWVQVGPKAGSNPGGVYQAPDGSQHYVKISKSEDHAKNEVLASKLYQACGVNSLEYGLVTKDGKLGVESEIKPGLKQASASQLAKALGMAEGFVPDAWLCNRDSIGLEYDNMKLNSAGHAVRLDPGGSLLYRAQGAPKPGFTDKVTDLDTLRNPKFNHAAASVFSGLTQQQLLASASRVTSIPDEKIRAIIEEHGPGSAKDRAALADKMIARKADIAARFPGAAIAHDSMMEDSPSSDMDDAMQKLSAQWKAVFDHMAHTVAKAFTERVLAHHDLAMKSSLDAAGFSVPFQMTPHMVDRVEGITAENVSLIKSIPQEFLGKVHAKVLESVRKGRDMSELASELEGLVELGKPNWNHNQVVRRARFIARQENNKATAAFAQIRQLDLGLEESYWQHTAASKEPRPEHEDWSDEGRKYKISTGMYSEVAEKFVLPGEDFNCGCTGAPIVPGYNDAGKGSEVNEEEEEGATV